MPVHPLKVDFNRGALDPRLHARISVEHYEGGADTMENVIVSSYGGFTRAPGTLHCGFTKGSADSPTRLLPFMFNAEQVYAIEAGDEYFRFWAIVDDMATPIVDGSNVPIEVATPYAAADVDNIRVRQSGDVLYLWCKGYRPQVLARLSEISWTLTDYVAQDGPYLPVNDTDTKLTLASRASLTPFMTTNVAAEGTASDHGGSSEAWKVFTGDGSTLVKYTGVNAGWIAFTFSGAPRVADAYVVVAPAGNQIDDMINAWHFEGYDGVDWVILDSRTEVEWARGERRYFVFDNSTAYEAYRLRWTSSAMGDSTLGDLQIHEKAEFQTPFSLVASSTEGINDDAGFAATDEGRSMRIFGTDGFWRWAEIVDFVSTTEVNIILHGHALPSSSKISLWRLGAWSDTTGWPAIGAIYEDRLFGAGADADPIGGSGSVNADYDNFATSQPLVADDAVSFRLTGGQLNQGLWMHESETLLIGTSGGIRSVGRITSNEAFGATNVRQYPQGKVGMSSIEPVEVGIALLLIDRQRKRVYEAIYSQEAGSYVPRALTVLNAHLLRPRIKAIAFQETPDPILWCVRDDGKLVALTYDRDQQVVGCTLVDVGGSVKSILALPGENKTNIVLMVRRSSGFFNTYRIEVLADINDGLGGDEWVHMASAGVYDGAATNTVTGLDWLFPNTVNVLADGVSYEGLELDAGVLTLPDGVTASHIVVGLAMPWRVRLLRLPNVGHRDGPALGRNAIITEAKIDILQTPLRAVNLKTIDVDATSEAFALKEDMDTETLPYQAPTHRTGVFKIEQESQWGSNVQLELSGNDAYPVFVRAVALEVTGDD